MMMGEVYSSQIFKKMTEIEIKRVATEMSNIDQIPPDAMTAVLDDFLNNFEDDNRMLIKGETFIKNVVNKTLGDEKAQAIFRTIEAQKREKPFVWSRDVDVVTLGSQIREEHPQTIAMILAHLPPDIAAEIMNELPENLKGDIAMRIARLGTIPDEILRDVDEELKAQVSDMGKAARAGGLQALVNILNGVDRSSEEVIMEAIEEANAEMAQEVRDMMFVFEDLAKIDDRAMREILKRVENQKLVLAMKTASEEMHQKILGNLSARASEMLLEDLEVMGPVRLSEVEEAQQDIIREAKELEAEGTIVLGGKGKEDILV